MPIAAPDPARILAILLGAEDFSGVGLPKRQSFATSKELFKQYLIDGVGVPLTNVLDLFDCDQNHVALGTAIERHIDSCSAGLKDGSAFDIIIYYVGHGQYEPNTRNYLLLLKGSRKDRLYDLSYPLKSLGQLLKAKAEQHRKYVILDCCFSGAAVDALMGGAEAPTQLLARHAEDVLKEDGSSAAISGDRPPACGTALLCASDAREPAVAPLGEHVTMFSGALLAALRQSPSGGADRVSLRQLRAACERLILARFGNDGVRPEVHSPDQRAGDLADYPLLPAPWSAKVARPLPQRRADAPLDALDPATFRDNPEAVHFLVVGAELPASTSNLDRHVRLALESYYVTPDGIAEASLALRRKLDGVAPNDALPPRVRSLLSLPAAFASEAALTAAVNAVCRAEVAVFDVTRLQPGVMILLGIRSVARRGVTICSYGDEFSYGDAMPLPFNLQMLNVAVHSRKQEQSGWSKPMDIIGKKIIRGLRELAMHPHYADLPTYDAVRTLGADPAHFEAIPRNRKVLVLCPFSDGYKENNWELVLNQELVGRLRQPFSDVRGGKAIPQVDATQHGGDLLVRLLDLDTPRLVSQALYELIRRIDLCVVDWTDFRPNVMFELGVRLAVNRLGAVHLMEDASARTRPLSKEAEGVRELKHVSHLLRRFRVFQYSCPSQEGESVDDGEVFREAIEWFDRGLRGDSGAEEGFSEQRRLDWLVYEIVGQVLEGDPSDVPPPIIARLLADADLLANSEQDSTGRSALLYGDVAAGRRARAEWAALERRVAAWLFMDATYAREDFAEEPDIAQQFRKLATDIRLFCNKQVDETGSTTLDARWQRLLERMAASIAKLPPTLAGEPSGHAVDTRLSDLVEEVKLAKSEAKLMRDAGSIDSAVAVLVAAIDAIDGSDWTRGIGTDGEAPEMQCEIAKQLADCLAMLGGNYRRQRKLAEAISCYERGRIYEHNPSYRFASTYNIVNAIVAKIEAGTQNAKSQRTELQKAVATLEGQIYESRVECESRRLDRWAWADLAQCHLLLGDVDAATEAYSKFKSMSDASAVRSSRNTLHGIYQALLQQADPIAECVKLGLELLQVGGET